jgi:succinylarginine dihydrolase
MTFEVNFDGLVGPTHNYAGLSEGNTHSIKNKNKPSNPKEAALQGLDKMKLLHDLGYKQVIVPPHERPLVGSYSDYENILINSSASSMWVANSATVNPSYDSNNNKLNLLVANLNHSKHRKIEAPQTYSIFKKIFNNEDLFKIHDYLKPNKDLKNDEGAANHTRFCDSYDSEGLHFFVYGKSENSWKLPQKYPARQTYEASLEVANRLGIKTAVFAQQSPKSIDAGVFHHDVIGVGNKNLYFYHEDALLDEIEVISELQDKFNGSLEFLTVLESEVPMEIAVETYLFNSQLLEYEDGHLLLAPIRCRKNKIVHDYLKKIVKKDNNSIKKIKFVNLEQSLWNGGGPACLRLRVVMKQHEFDAIHSGVIFTNELHRTLRKWVNTYYVDNLIYDDLALPSFIRKCRKALNELTEIMQLGKIYMFQNQ